MRAFRRQRRAARSDVASQLSFCHSAVRERSGATAAAAALLLAASCGGDSRIQLPVPMSDNPPIEYPVELWDARIQGETMLMVHIDADGRVDSARVEESSGSPQLDSAAIHGGRQMRFTPGRRGDRRVGAWVRIPVRFQRDSSGVGTP